MPVTLTIVALCIKKIAPYFMWGSDSLNKNLNKSCPLLEDGSSSSSVNQFNGFTEGWNESISSSTSIQMTETSLESIPPLPKLSLKKRENIYDVPVRHIYAVPIKKPYDNKSVRDSELDTEDALKKALTEMNKISEDICKLQVVLACNKTPVGNCPNPPCHIAYDPLAIQVVYPR